MEGLFKKREKKNQRVRGNERDWNYPLTVVSTAVKKKSEKDGVMPVAKIVPAPPNVIVIIPGACSVEMNSAE